ncbi:MAG: hypothetical protein ACD_62C00665G0001 [uncultured bacterium]|nr:MAG: hypothetical protein ACD_62C00665G0001 [uncultured bacterium]
MLKSCLLGSVKEMSGQKMMVIPTMPMRTPPHCCGMILSLGLNKGVNNTTYRVVVLLMREASAGATVFSAQNKKIHGKAMPHNPAPMTCHRYFFSIFGTL